MDNLRLPEGIAHLQGSSDAVARVKAAMALCEGYTLEELQRMSLTFKAQIDVLRARPAVPDGYAHIPPASPVPLTDGDYKTFKLGWLECEAAHRAMLAAAQEVSHD